MAESIVFGTKMILSSINIYGWSFIASIGSNVINPNRTKYYKIVQKLSPKHAARGVAQSPNPIYRHGKVCLSKQPPWRAAGGPRLAHGRSRCVCFFLHPPFLPPSGDSFFTPSPPNPQVG